MSKTINQCIELILDNFPIETMNETPEVKSMYNTLTLAKRQSPKGGLLKVSSIIENKINKLIVLKKQVKV